MPCFCNFPFYSNSIILLHLSTFSIFIVNIFFLQNTSKNSFPYELPYIDLFRVMGSSLHDVMESSLREGYNFKIVVNVLAKHSRQNHHNIHNSPYWRLESTWIKPVTLINNRLEKFQTKYQQTTFYNSRQKTLLHVH